MRVQLKGQREQAQYRAGFGCWPPNHIEVEIWDKDADFLMVLTHPLEFAAPGVFAGWLTVPAGGVFDSVSSGRGAGRAVFGRGKNARAGAVHDWLYSTSAPKHITRAQADEVLYRAAVYGGCHPARARAAWAAVRLAGGLFWKKRAFPVRKEAQ